MGINLFEMKKAGWRKVLVTLGLIALAGFLLGAGSAMLWAEEKEHAATESTEEPELVEQYTSESDTSPAPASTPEPAALTMAEYMDEHGLTEEDYPPSLLALAERKPEAEDFVMCYPVEKDMAHEIDMTEYVQSSEVPLLLQWDKRWGYIPYGDDVAGLTGCGPTCLSMAALWLTKNPIYSPDYLLNWAVEQGYCVEGSGSSWTLISEGAEKLGMCVTELPLYESAMADALAEGKLIVCVVGPGDFTTTGHFLLLTGYEDGAFRVNDSNSTVNSRILWNYDTLADQMMVLWALGT